MPNNQSNSLSSAKLKSKHPARSAATAGRGGGLDPPTPSDHRRVRFARRQAQARAKEIEKAHKAAVLEVFRAEMGTTVRSASLLLTPLFAELGMTLDEAVTMIQPMADWPNHPPLLGSKGALRSQSHIHHYYSPGLRRTHITRPPLNSCTFDLPSGGYLMLQIFDHSVDLIAGIGNVVISTRFGELRVEFLDQIPEAIFGSCVGRLIEEVVDHSGWRGRGWRIVKIDDGYPPLCGQAFIANIGSEPYQMPWAR